MSFALGAFYPLRSSSASVTSLRSFISDGSHSDSDVGKDESFALQRSLPRTTKRSKALHKSISSRVLNSTKRDRADSAPIRRVLKSSLDQRPGSSPAEGLQSSRTRTLEFTGASSIPVSPASRPRHIPIVIPEYVSVSSNTDSASGFFSSWIPSVIDHPPSVTLSASDGIVSSGPVRAKPRHVEIKIPDWAQPILKQPKTPPRVKLTQSVFVDPFVDIYNHSSLKMSRPRQDSSRTNTLDSQTSQPAARTLYANPSNSDSQAYLYNVNSSQSSLPGRQEGDESASDAESQPQDGTRPNRPSQSATQAAHTDETTQQNDLGTDSGSLSGLVCNVHRTTGKEPPPLVGATTTILGDKLYVFGGRKLSRSKPQLTSNLYELDLIKRHWTKLEVKGDHPPARYFHSVCPLGDTKLVCYGGMSPVSQNMDSAPESQPEVVVMSDIHIFDVRTMTWMRVNCQEIPQGRYAHCAAILPSSSVFASAGAPMSAVQHNPSGSNPNQGTLGIALDGSGGAEMVVVGGQDSGNHYIEQVSVFNLRSLKWTGTTGMGRSCGAYRSVVAPLTSLCASQIGAGSHVKSDFEEEDETSTKVSGAPMLIYSNYNFLDVKLELQVRLVDGTLIEKPMQSGISPPGLRFPNGGVIANHFVVSGTFLTSSKQEYALWALDLRTLAWSRIDAGGSIFSQGSWNRGVLWARRNSFVILGNRKRSLVDDYNNRRINFTNMCLVELEAFGLYDNPRRTDPASNYISASAQLPRAIPDMTAAGRKLLQSAEELGSISMGLRELCDMDFLAVDGTRIPVNSRLISRRWGQNFAILMRDAIANTSETDTPTLRPVGAGHPSRNSSVTITPSVNSATTITASNTNTNAENSETKTVPPRLRPRVFYLPHTAQTLGALLHYLYTSSLPPPTSELAGPQIYCSLLQIARPYRIDGLLEAVVERLHESLDGRNAAAVFNAAAMAAGSGEAVSLAAIHSSRRGSTIPLRGASLGGLDALTTNGTGRSAASLRIDTEVANGRSTRNTIRPGQSFSDNEDEPPDSAATDTSLSDLESSLTPRKDREIWSGDTSAVVGLQKRGLRGLMEGRRIRERGRSEGNDGKIGLGIA